MTRQRRVNARVRIEVASAADPVFEFFLDGWPLLLLDLEQGLVRVNDLRASHAYSHAAPLPRDVDAAPLVETGAGGQHFEIVIVLGHVAAYIHPGNDEPTYADVLVVSLEDGYRVLLDTHVRYRQLPRRALAPFPGVAGAPG